jgi:hypothetical protein
VSCISQLDPEENVTLYNEPRLFGHIYAAIEEPLCFLTQHKANK